MDKKIVTLTMNPAVDKSASVGRVTPDAKLRCEDPVLHPGGGGVNVSRAIAKLGGGSMALHCSGGPSGETLSSLLEREGVEQRRVEVEGLTRTNLTVFENETRRQYRFNMPGPKLGEGEWNECLAELASALRDADFLVASGSLPPGAPEDLYAKAAAVADRHGCKTIVDASGDPLRMAARAGVFLIKPNIRELCSLTGRDADSEAAVLEMARELAGEGKNEAVVVSLGGQGAILVTEDECRRAWAPTVPIRSKVGAGDSMVAGMVLALARGEGLYEAVRGGVAAGAAAVMTPGTELCRREDAERLLREMTDRDGKAE